MVGGAVENQEDILAGKFSGEDIEEDLEACRIRCRHDQINAGSVLRTNRSVQVDVFANELGGHLGPGAHGSPARPRAVHPAEPCFISEHDPYATTPPCGSPPSFPHSIWKTVFLIAFWAARSRLG
jgi:hypothetical protein